MTIRDELIKEIGIFLKRTGLTPTQFGQLAMADKAFVFRLRAGVHPHSKTVDRLRVFMTTYSKPSRKARKPSPKRAAAQHAA